MLDAGAWKPGHLRKLVDGVVHVERPVQNDEIHLRAAADWLCRAQDATPDGGVCGRYLLRYVLPEQLQAFSDGSSRVHYVTCTPYSPEETIGQLALPRGAEPRSHVFLLRPSKLKKVSGPRWVRGGYGIEYLLPEGFGKDALVLPWAIAVE